ncbi:uncharacterized protein GGS22DRAFT_162568 [Annulohypoxylon maeteangense]|uniref:uncharacterized protein n=1 Tax=Annulohypoxylon maeteangense TaxID=1927788 RepID=UPI002008B99A|nr:uncharacterized protein GGS22DRAFT_162568 [Annulohypoxylon maeteangense]KAI0885038.1 hypothetical protein GGS22DRAFT_162568 [Annulohypoxylon maeteangense]
MLPPLTSPITTTTQPQPKMSDSTPYPLPQGLHLIPQELLDTRPDASIDHTIQNPPPVTSSKNIWFFWDTGYASMHNYTKRNIRSWHRRLSKQNWTIRVLDRVPGSPSNVSNFLPVTDPTVFPRAFTEGTISGRYAVQHASDLVRFPLLLRYGGVYADVGLLQIGDLDRLWRSTVGDPGSPFEVLSYNMNNDCLANYFLASLPENPLFERCHRLLLALWGEGGGKTGTEGMSDSELLKGVPLMGGSFTIEEEGKVIPAEEVQKLLSDYIIQGQAITMVMGLVDEEDGWDGPKYVAERVYGIDYMEGSQLINVFTGWDGRKAFELMSLALPKDGEVESAEQKQAREIVEGCLQRSFGFKLAHGLIIRVFKCTLGSLWRENEGSDDVPGTYAHWLRYATNYWNQDELPAALEFPVREPLKRGRLLGGK